MRCVELDESCAHTNLVNTLAAVVGHNVDTSHLGAVAGIGDRISVGKLHGQLACERAVGCVLVDQNVKAAECGVGCTGIHGILNGIDLCIAEYNLVALNGTIVVELGKRCLIKEQEVEIAILNVNGQGDVIVGGCCTLEQVRAVQIDPQTCGKRTVNGNGVRAVLLGNGVVQAVDVQEVVGLCLCIHNRILGKGCTRKIHQLAGCIVKPKNTVGFIQQGVLIVGKGDQCLDLCDLLSRQSLAGIDVQLGQNTSVGIVDGDLYRRKIRINRYVLGGHGGQNVAVSIRPIRHVVADEIGVVLEDAKVCTNGKECGEQGLAGIVDVVAVTVGDAVNAGKLCREVNVNGDVVHGELIYKLINELVADVKAQQIHCLVNQLLRQLLGVAGDGSLLAEHAVAYVRVCDGVVHHAVGNEVADDVDVCLYFIEGSSLGSSASHCGVIHLFHRVGLQYCLDILANLCGNDICDRCGNIIVGNTVENVSGGNIAQIVAQLLADQIQHLLYLGVADERVELAGALLEDRHHVAVGAIFNDLADTVCAGDIQERVLHIVHVQIGEVDAYLPLNLFQSRLYVADTGQCVKESVGVNGVEDLDQIAKLDAVHKSNGGVCIRRRKSQKLLLDAVRELIGVDGLLIKNRQRFGRGKHGGLNAEIYVSVRIHAEINIAAEQLIQLARSLLQRCEIAFQYNIKGNVLCLGLGCALGEVNHSQRGADDGVVLEIFDVLERGNDLHQRLDQRFGIEDQTCSVGIFLCDDVAVDGEKVNVPQNGVECRLCHRNCVRLEIHALQDVHNGLVGKLTNDVVHTDQIHQCIGINSSNVSIYAHNIGQGNIGIVIDRHHHLVYQLLICQQCLSVGASEHIVLAAHCRKQLILIDQLRIGHLVCIYIINQIICGLQRRQIHSRVVHGDVIIINNVVNSDDLYKGAVIDVCINAGDVDRLLQLEAGCQLRHGHIFQYGGDIDLLVNGINVNLCLQLGHTGIAEIVGRICRNAILSRLRQHHNATLYGVIAGTKLSCIQITLGERAVIHSKLRVVEIIDVIAHIDQILDLGSIKVVLAVRQSAHEGLQTIHVKGTLVDQGLQLLSLYQARALDLRQGDHVGVQADQLSIKQHLEANNSRQIGACGILQLFQIEIADQLTHFDVVEDFLHVHVLHNDVFIHDGLKIHVIREQLKQLLKLNVLQKSGNVYIIQNQVGIDLCDKRIHIDCRQQILLRNDLKQLLQCKDIQKRRLINRNSRFDLLQQGGRDSTLLQDRGKLRRADRYSHRGIASLGLSVHLDPSIGKSTDRQHGQNSDKREHQGKYLAEILHNKTSLL